MVEQIHDKKRWGLSKQQKSIKFKTKKYKGSMNGRIGWRQKKMGVEQTVEQNWTKKDAYLKNGRLGFGQEQYKVETEKDEGPTNSRLGFGFLHLQLSLMRFRIMTEKDGV